MNNSRLALFSSFVCGMLLCIWMLKRPASSFHGNYLAFIGASDLDANSEAYSSPNELALCGEICTYGGREVLSATKANSKYPQLEKVIDCQNIMRRMAYRKQNIVDPPPKAPPKELLDNYTMNGHALIKYTYQNNVKMHRSHSAVTFDNLIKQVLKGRRVSMYGEGGCVRRTLKRYISRISHKHGVVVGTQKPWVEAILVAYNVSMVTTLEYTNLTIEHPKVQIHTPYDFADMYLQGRAPQFDFGVTFSSLEHSGLGRYGDPLNPYGDLEAMAQVWCMTKPGGMLAVGVPGGRSQIVWNVHRIYDKKRLAHLTANWHVDEIVKCRDVHTFIVLTKPI